MTFIVALISLIIERYFYWSQLRQWRWLRQYQQILNAKVGYWNSNLLFLATVLPPVIIIGLIQILLRPWLFGFLELFFGILVLLYCFGPENVWAEAYGCIHDFSHGDRKVLVEKMRSFGIEFPEDSEQLHFVFASHIFAGAYYRVFAVIFWFLVLGPVGAVLYRIVVLLHLNSPLGVTPVAAKVQHVMDWVPVRLFTFLFALGGHYSATLACWKQHVTKGLEANDEILKECSVAALDKVDSNSNVVVEKEALNLLDRVFVMSLVVLAVIVLLS